MCEADSLQRTAKCTYCRMPSAMVKYARFNTQKQQLQLYSTDGKEEETTNGRAEINTKNTTKRRMSNRYEAMCSDSTSRSN